MCIRDRNIRLDNVTVTSKDGKISILDQIYLRGASLRFIIVPDMFKNAPMFKRLKAQAKIQNQGVIRQKAAQVRNCLLYTSPSPRDKRQSRMPSSA
eukprot:TRINITY_DN5088_c0_g1_i1.p2 TRINITY_DN5088_c0_g1~~TRINITY_DN5088_c0_g1_i1.p2  ORF type:complete len:104 (+),score=61.20 TRINITY_DN5088_c0_g1_i1:25-312(+)